MPNINESSSYVSQAKTKALMGKWSKRIAITEGALRKQKLPGMNLEKKAALATTLENTQRMLEATQATNIGQYKRFALDLVQSVVPNLLAYDLFSVQPIDNRVGMVNYIKYSYGSTKGSATAGDTFASPLAYQGSNMNYTSSAVPDEFLVDAADHEDFSGTLSWTPVRPGSVIIVVDGKKIVDNGSGVLASTEVTLSSTDGDNVIDYASGAYKFKLTTAATQQPTASYMYDNEVVPAQVPELNLSIESLPIQTQSRKLKALYSFDSSYELSKEYGQDVNELLAAQAAAEISYEIDTELQLTAFKSAAAGHITWSIKQPVGVNITDHYDSFYASIIKAGNMIFDKTRRASANWMVAGIEVASVIQASRQFKPATVAAGTVGPHYIGTYGSIAVYINPNFGARDFLLGYKGDSLFEAGLIYAPYMPILSTDVITLDDFMGRRAWATMYGKRMVNPLLYLTGTVTD